MATRTQKKMVPVKANMPEWSLRDGEHEFRDICDSILNCMGSHGEVLELKGIDLRNNILQVPVMGPRENRPKEPREEGGIR